MAVPTRLRGPQTGPVCQTAFSETHGQFSPDGRWSAFVFEKSGRGEVYARPFPPAPGAKWQISTGGATQPRWRREGKELFFASTDRKLMVVPVKAGAAFKPGLPQELFQTRMNLAGSAAVAYSHAVSADGASTPITMVLNCRRAGSSNAGGGTHLAYFCTPGT